MNRTSRYLRAPLTWLLLAAALIRVLFALELAGGPIPHSRMHPDSDMHFFSAWAERVAAGDLLQREPMHPFHVWHEQVAAAYLTAHPEIVPELEIAPLPPVHGIPPDRLNDEARTWVGRYVTLWNRWYGGTQFHQEPLYPYLLGAVYAVVGPEPWAMIWLQFAAGLATVALVYALARRWFGTAAGVVAAAAAVLCGPLLYYEVVLLRAAFITTATLGLLLLALRAAETPTRARWLAFGIGAGVATLLKSTFAPFAIAVAITCWWRAPARRELLRPLLVAAAGGLLVLLPVVARNLAVGAAPFALTSVGPVTFAASNTPGYPPALGWYPDPEQVAAVLHEGHTMLPVASATIARHGSVFGWLQLLVQKGLQVLHELEIPNNTSLLYDQTVWTTLRWLPVGFALVFPLALVGLIVALRRRLLPASYGWMLLVTVGPLVLFYVLSRFRLPLLALLLPPAAFGLLSVLTAARARAWGRLAWMVPLLLGSAWFLARDLEPRPLVARGHNYRLDVENHWAPRIEEALHRNDLRRAGLLLVQARRRAPDLPPDAIAIDAATRWVADARLLWLQAQWHEARGEPQRARICAGEAERLTQAARAAIPGQNNR